MPALALAKMGKMLAADVASGEMGDASRMILHGLEHQPELVIDILEDLIAEGGKPDAEEDIIAADILMLGWTLEFVRYGVEAGRREAIALADRARSTIVEAEAKGQIEPGLLLFILNQFGTAKLDVGDELRQIMMQAIQAQAEQAGEDDDGRAGLRAMARDLGEDPFDIHAGLSETDRKSVV